MNLELLRDITKYIQVQEALKELGDRACSMRQNFNARIETPVLEDGTRLFDTFLNSKTVNLHGGTNEDNRHRFKIDHAFDLSYIINSSIDSDGSILIGEYLYTKSQGTEFIIISGKEVDDILDPTEHYVIRADKYEKIRERLNKGGYKAGELLEVGGFMMTYLKAEEISTHDGWKELAVGKNNASEQDYEEASKFLKEEYVPKAQQNRCFPEETTGMNFVVYDYKNGYSARPWILNGSEYRSDAHDCGSFLDSGCFLRVPDKSLKTHIKFESHT